MDTLSALQRKFARELAALRLRRLAEEHCTIVCGPSRPPTSSRVPIRRVASAGFRLPSFT